MMIVPNSLDRSKLNYKSEKFREVVMYPAKKRKALPSLKVPCLLRWAHLGLNQGPPDYESGALTN